MHGICLAPEGPHAGERFAHAWVEEGQTLGQSGLLEDETKIWFTVDRDAWYRAVRVQVCTRYTLVEARRLYWQHGHMGPWGRAYRALCSTENRVFGPISESASDAD